MSLEEKLRSLKKYQDEEKTTDWNSYKEEWKKAITDIQNRIMYDWFAKYDEQQLMQFSIFPVKRIEPFLGEYLTNSLEIALVNNKTFLLEPINGLTSDYNGKLEFNLLGNVYKRVSILREIAPDNKSYRWLIAKSFNKDEYIELNKTELEKLMEEWLS